MKRYPILLMLLLMLLATGCTAQGSATVVPQSASSGAAINNEDEMIVPTVEASHEMTDNMSDATTEDTAGVMSDDMQGEMGGEKSPGMADASTDETSGDAAGETANETMSGDMSEAASESEHAQSDGAMDSGDMKDASGETVGSDMGDTDMPGAGMSSHETALALWQTLPLMNVRTGETFMLSDFAGKTLFVEPMATWCTNCRRQLNNIQSARAGLDSDEVVFVALSVETNISAPELARYADDNGFDLLFAVMSPEILQSFTETFGRTIANPPATPHFIVRSDGSITELFTGIKSPEDIIAVIGG